MSLETIIDTTNFIFIQQEDTSLDGLYTSIPTITSQTKKYSSQQDISKDSFIDIAMKEAKTEMYLLGGLTTSVIIYLLYQSAKHIINKYHFQKK